MGLDAEYFSRKLCLVLRDICQYTDKELALELYRLATTASDTIQSERINELGRQLAASEEARKQAEAERNELRKWKEEAEKQEAIAWMQQHPTLGVSVSLKPTAYHTRALYPEPIPSPDVAELQKRTDGLLELNAQLSKDHAAYALKCNDLSVRNDELQKRVAELDSLCRFNEKTMEMFEAAVAQAEEKGRKEAVPDVDKLSNIIRAVDGNNSLGAGVLAEKIVECLLSAAPKKVE